MSYLKKRLSERLKDPAFLKEWEDSELEYIIARNIIKLRNERNLTQTDLASALNTKQSVVSRIENGNQNISLTTLKSIAKVLNVKVIDIIKEEEKNELELESSN